MTRFGYKLSSEEHGPAELVRYAARAEEAGFDFVSASDHYHPWIDAQGHSPFVWAVLGGVAATTRRIGVLTGVTCPTMRIHPAIVAHAAATAACLLPGRFALGVGSGEALNEHVLGGRWPAADERLDMLEEAVGVMRLLWNGGTVTYRGAHYRVENARIYDLPEEPPPIMMAASGPRALELAGATADGLISLAPVEGIVQRFRSAGGEGKPAYAEAHVCYGDDAEEMRAVAHRQWPITGLGGQLTQELALPSLFEAAASAVDRDTATEDVACGNDVDEHVAAIGAFVDAGYDHVWVHNIGPNQDAFFDFYRNKVLPALR